VPRKPFSAYNSSAAAAAVVAPVTVPRTSDASLAVGGFFRG
jgi:hypothetical protein